ncbi:amidohydrolase family protein [Gramella jeungdoensis]|uniref:Amidohydrolase family protein n=1 Tax=Gramella jeungdoensis TaxID=708091 RepID=A0ABT0YX28_9FLAO|nr:amidohydrolase family protein [Gramella jeungdoensis]MCM8568011.1 amidohydrolase family protein [Gramella jeungdoensis]
MKKIIFSCFILFLFLSCKEEEKKRSFDLLITNASIVDIAKDQIYEKRFLAISNNTIQLVENMEEIEEYESSEVLDAENNFVMPGLWDMHVHFRGGDSLIQENKELLKLFLAYGVTTVRDAGGDITPAVLDWKKSILEGSLAGPHIFTSGTKLDGENPAWEGSIPVTNSEEIGKALDSLEKINVDYVKIYDGSLTAETYYDIIDKAEARGLKTTSHVPMSARLLTAVDHGLDGVEHLYYIAKAGSPLADSLSRAGVGYQMMPQIAESHDEELANEVYTKLAANDVSVTLTLHINKVLANILKDDHSKDSLRNYVGEGIQKTYQKRIQGAKRAKASGSNFKEGLDELFASMVVPMYENNVNILAGSDSGAFNSFVYSGESLHLELEAMVNSGLTPAQALETSFINGPKFFGLEDSYGSLEKGKIADMIVLEKNPLEEIKNTRSIKFVIKNNKIYTPGDLLKNLNN